MATCKECLYYKACFTFQGGMSREFIMGDKAEKKCGLFKNKSRYIELPCEVGQTVWFVNAKIIYKGKIICIRPFVHKDYITFHADVEYEFLDPFYNDGRKMKHKISVVFEEFGSKQVAYFTKKEAENSLKGECAK